MENIKDFFNVPSGFGDGSGYGYGCEYGHEYGSGFGYEYGHEYGYGDGTGDESGNGSGYGHGDGSGERYGSGYGDGDGDGDGDVSRYWPGYGYNIKLFCDKSVFMIDDIPTIITAVFGRYAMGYILKGDLTTERCFVAKGDGGIFAHGNTIQKAEYALLDKMLEDMPEEDRIRSFAENHKWGKHYPASDFFAWHHRLTGSCEMGRLAFVRERGIDLENGTYTVEEFINLTKAAYGGKIITKLEEFYHGKL